MKGKSQGHVMDTMVESGVQGTIPKMGDANCGSVTVRNGHGYPVVVTANNGFMGFQSSACIMPNDSVTMPIGICAAVDLFCWHMDVSGVHWEGQAPVFVMHYHEVQWTVWVGQEAVFGAQTMAAGAAK